MARKILCEGCNAQTRKAALQYGEVWETIKGTPIKELTCDDCGMKLDAVKEDSTCQTCGQFVKGSLMGDICYAGVLIDSKSRPAYEREQPKKWASAYINEVITCKNCNKETPTVECLHCGHDNTNEK